MRGEGGGGKVCTTVLILQLYNQPTQKPQKKATLNAFKQLRQHLVQTKPILLLNPPAGVG